MFSSVTEWQAEDHVVSVRVDGFETVEAASAFGNAMGLRLRLAEQQLVLIEPGGTQRVIDDEHASVTRLRPESREKLMVSAYDYEAMQIPVAEYGATPGLNGGFGALSYGVLDANGFGVTFRPPSAATRPRATRSTGS